MNSRKIEELKDNIRNLDSVYTEGHLIINEINSLIKLVNKYRTSASERTSIGLYEKIEDEYIFDLIKRKLVDINLRLLKYKNLSYGVHGVGYLVEEIEEIDSDIRFISTGKYCEGINLCKLIIINKHLRDLREDIFSIEKKIELFEKREINGIERERNKKKFDDKIIMIEKLGEE